MTPKPWSHSALESFKNCPRAFHATRILKSVTEVKGEATLWGEKVHKHFEEFLRDGIPLPPSLEMHEEFLLRLHNLPGQGYIEQEIALNNRGQVCGYWDDDVWYRGKIDYQKINGDHALVIDHKTGKYHQKLGQLFLFMLHTFAAYPQVMRVTAEYYWTQSKATNGVTYGRERIPELWRMFAPDIKQYAEAFKTDTWQPRQSGLCRRHCAVLDCEFNGQGLRR